MTAVFHVISDAKLPVQSTENYDTKDLSIRVQYKS